MTTDVIQEIESNIKEAQKIVEMGNALNRLKHNQDFKKVIMEGFFKQEAIRLVHLRSDTAMQSQAMQDSINKQIDAIGSLSQYFQVIQHQASLAVKAIAADEEARDEILAEGNE